MNFLDLLTMSVNNLWRRKLRTFLTVLGVIIGTASIVVMISLGMGMNKANMEQIEKYGGLTTINVYANENGSSTHYGSGTAVSDGGVSGSGSGKNEPVRLDDAMIETLKNIPHVSFVSPMLTMSVVAKQGAYICSYLNVVAMEPEAFTQMNIKVGQGSLPRAGDQELKFFYGNTVATNFMNEKTQQYYWETGQVPDVDFMNQPMFVIFDQDAYWKSQNGNGMNVDENGNATVTQPPKKYMIESCGVMAGGVEDWADNSDSVLCDINLFKTYIRRVFKNKAIPGQPTTSSGKPYKELYYNQAYVKVDNVDNMKDVQKSIQNLGLNASSNAEWIEQMQEQSRNIQLVLGGIGAVSLFVAAIGIANTMMMSIYERTKEIGIIKVLGCALQNIREMFLMEAGFIGFLGGVIGVVLSYIISFIINFVASRQGGDYYSSISYIPPWLVLVAVGFAVLVGMVAGFFPAVRAMKLSPLAAIRNE